jgi:peptidoglycan/LPS O-acetylase OafA/YrhL
LITGILLAGAVKHGHVSLVNFYSRRARRILPAATLTLVVTTIVAYQLLNYVRTKQVVWDSFWASLFAANIRFAQQGADYFAQGQPPSLVQHYWSLAVEEQFYLVWPTLLSLTLFGLALGGVSRRRAGETPMVTNRQCDGCSSSLSWRRWPHSHGRSTTRARSRPSPISRRSHAPGSLG